MRTPEKTDRVRHYDQGGTGIRGLAWFGGQKETKRLHICEKCKINIKFEKNHLKIGGMGL